MAEAKVYIAVPNSGAITPEAMGSLLQSTAEHKAKIACQFQGSLLGFNFNSYWCEAEDERKETGTTHWAMHHDDLAGEIGWLDKMVAEMDRTGADILSVAAPIKDGRGVTSCGWMNRKNWQITRLTMDQVCKLPPTFDAAELEKHRDVLPNLPDAPIHLAINTGMLLVRFTDPWIEEFPGFNIADKIERITDKDGNKRAMAFVLPEDWNFSKWAGERGLKVFATRKVRLRHKGDAWFDNDHAWGTEKIDPGDKR